MRACLVVSWFDLHEDTKHCIQVMHRHGSRSFHSNTTPHHPLWTNAQQTSRAETVHVYPYFLVVNKRVCMCGQGHVWPTCCTALVDDRFDADVLDFSSLSLPPPSPIPIPEPPSSSIESFRLVAVSNIEIQDESPITTLRGKGLPLPTNQYTVKCRENVFMYIWMWPSLHTYTTCAIEYDISGYVRMCVSICA